MRRASLARQGILLDMLMHGLARAPAREVLPKFSLEGGVVEPVTRCR